MVIRSTMEELGGGHALCLFCPQGRCIDHSREGERGEPEGQLCVPGEGKYRNIEACILTLTNQYFYFMVAPLSSPPHPLLWPFFSRLHHLHSHEPTFHFSFFINCFHLLINNIITHLLPCVI